MSALRMAGSVPGLSSLPVGLSWPSFHYRLRTGQASSGWTLRVGFRSRGCSCRLRPVQKQRAELFLDIFLYVKQMAATSVVRFCTFVLFFSFFFSGMAMPRHSRKKVFPTCPELARSYRQGLLSKEREREREKGLVQREESSV